MQRALGGVRSFVQGCRPPTAILQGENQKDQYTTLLSASTPLPGGTFHGPAQLGARGLQSTPFHVAHSDSHPGTHSKQRVCTSAQCT